MQTPDRQPVGEVLSGMRLEPLPDGVSALSVIYLIKALDDDGVVCWYIRTPNDMHGVEQLGALTSARDAIAGTVYANWTNSDGEDAS